MCLQRNVCKHIVSNVMPRRGNGRRSPQSFSCGGRADDNSRCCPLVSGDSHIYPATRPGKYLCMLCAVFGSRLRVMVLTDTGDVLATFSSTSDNRFQKLSCLLFPNGAPTALQEEAIPRAHCSCPPQSTERGDPCPELVSRKLSDSITGNPGRWDGRQRWDVPLPVIVLVVYAYISCATAILPTWAKRLDFGDAFYFCFTTGTTVRFGHTILEQPHVFFCIITGTEIVWMAFKEAQNRLMHIYKNLMLSLANGSRTTLQEREGVTTSRVTCVG